MGTTLNDVVLAICAGALRRYLNENKKLPLKPLVAMVPISTRSDQNMTAGGNNISSMLIQLATDIENPIERLEIIHDNAIRGKAYHKALGARTLADLAESVPFGIANQAARLYSRFHLAKLHNPVFNCVITNVPGPQIPIYIEGHKVLFVMGTAPIIDGMGLMITVFSYNGYLTISPTSDVKSMPDLDRFTRYLRESANELEVLAQNYQKSQTVTRIKEKSVHTPMFFKEIRSYLQKNKRYHTIEEGTVHIHVTSPEVMHYQISFDGKKPSVRKGKPKRANLKITTTDKYIRELYHGKLDIETAVIQGKIGIRGEQELAMQMGKIISHTFVTPSGGLS